MKLRVFSVFDKAVELFMPPIFLRSEAEAVRALRLSMRGEHTFAQSPSDYALYDLGEFDEANGTFLRTTELPRRVCDLSALVGE